MRGQELIDEIEAMAEDLGLDLREDYSGRGMYGRTCYGIVTDSPSRTLMECGKRDMPEPRRDSMGLSTILYWPQTAT